MWIASLLLISTLVGQNNGITENQFTLHKSDNQFKLVFDSDTFSLNTEWLIPTNEYREYQGMSTSAFGYDNSVTTFVINDNLTGLHLSSYEILTEGSAQSSTGKDVFLILKSDGTITFGGISLGITKSRARSEGSFYASTSHFIISDINSDGSIDIGVIREKYYVNREVISDSIDGESIQVQGPYFKQEPIDWYLFSTNKWVKSNSEGVLDTVYDLPLIGLKFSPVDYVAHLRWNSYDPRQWDTESTDTTAIYNPSYRTYIIENQVIHMP